MSERIDFGTVAVEIDDSGLVRHIDRVTEGSATSFIRIASRHLGEVQSDAEPLWPRRTGRSAEGFGVRSRVSGDQIRVALSNVHRHTWFVKFSVRTEASLDAEARAVASRGKSPEAQAKLLAFWRARLLGRHGKGAPLDRLTGRRAWIELVRKPAKKATRKRALVSELQTDLNKLAGRS
ncbi:MAG: hypothetical protein GY873_02465 [Bosea sp.]|uniref:hypothetical protein n=1 Tax=Bosea sp. (in: a-proteobacteria) TaxID=1871050 RepID=UPI00238C9936|nr:hypothetical protein [Bosea sp. (in: a-proteobacteria)]